MRTEYNSNTSDVTASAVVLRVAPADAQRILRALDEASLTFGPSPGGAPGASNYRRLAAEIRSQANGATRPITWRAAPSAAQLH